MNARKNNSITLKQLISNLIVYYSLYYNRYFFAANIRNSFQLLILPKYKESIPRFYQKEAY